MPGTKERGGAEIALVIASGFFLLTMGALMQDTLAHRRIHHALTERISLQYQAEAVLWEAVSFLQDGKPCAPDTTHPSSFSPNAVFSIDHGEEMITVKIGERVLMEAIFTQDDDSVTVVGLRSLSNIPYTR